MRAIALFASLAIAVSWMASPALACTVIHVPREYRSIGDAIGAAGYCDRVMVSAGRYQENVVMKAGVDLIGAGTNVTIIEALDVVITGADDATIRGFTIRGGYVGVRADNVSKFSVLNNVVTKLSNPDFWDGAEGIHITNSTDVIVSNNEVSHISDEYWDGTAGIHIASSTDVFVCNNEVNHISDDAWGGAAGIHITNSADVFVCNNEVSLVRDEDWDGAAGIHLSGNSAATIFGNTISDILDEEWDSPHGIFDENSIDSRIVGNLVVSIEDQEWDHCYGIRTDGSYADVVYNTVVFITDDEWDEAYGIHNRAASATISNNIVAHVEDLRRGNAWGIYDLSGTSVISHNNAWDVMENVDLRPRPGVAYYGFLGPGNLKVDPLFVNAAEREFRLQPGSPLRTASESGSEIGVYGAPCLCSCETYLSDGTEFTTESDCVRIVPR